MLMEPRIREKALKKRKRFLALIVAVLMTKVPTPIVELVAMNTPKIKHNLLLIH